MLNILSKHVGKESSAYLNSKECESCDTRTQYNSVYKSDPQNPNYKSPAKLWRSPRLTVTASWNLDPTGKSENVCIS